MQSNKGVRYLANVLKIPVSSKPKYLGDRSRGDVRLNAEHNFT